MCGIAGYIAPHARQSEDELHAIANGMAERMRSRGPDDHGAWVHVETGVVLSHVRLSIVDLSAAGHQPMTSISGRYVIVYNGEIYNAEELRLELPEIAWRGHSDTEVILEACERWGLAATVEKLIGMFAIALWDCEERTLQIVRDRLGIKPLYWGQVNDTFLFSSELKPLLGLAGWSWRIDRGALASFMRFGYVPATNSILEGIRKLAPGHMLTWRNGNAEIKPFWSLREVAVRERVHLFGGSDEEAVGALDALIRDAVSRRMVADVPVGAFLSGGIDSSTVVAAMRAESSGPVHTYSVGLDMPGYDETQHARAVARHLGTDHTELFVTPADALNVIPDLPEYYDEPFADVSQIPTYLISKLARDSVTVALSGDGGDEMFGGYNRYIWGERVWRRMGPMPGFVKHALASGMRVVSPGTWNAVAGVIPAAVRPSLMGIKAHKAADILDSESEAQLYRRLVTIWEYPERLVSGAREPVNALWDETLADELASFQVRMQVLDGLTYLPDDILTKVDRASMAVGLEARVPLLDHRIVEFAYGLPQHLRIREGQGKWILREVLSRYMPRELFERPKMGFAVPVGAWLSGALRDWCESLLDHSRLKEDGILDADAVRRVWQEHLSGRVNHEMKLWTVLMFQAWRAHWSGVTAR